MLLNLNNTEKEIYSRQTALHKYGKSPAIKLNGHINAVFPYIQAPLDYIIPELLKNAVR